MVQLKKKTINYTDKEGNSKQVTNLYLVTEDCEGNKKVILQIEPSFKSKKTWALAYSLASKWED